MKRLVLVLNFSLPLVSLLLFSTASSTSLWLWLGVLLLSIAPFMAMLNSSNLNTTNLNTTSLNTLEWIDRSCWSATAALFLVIVFSTVDLWSHLLNQSTPPLAIHLLVLLIALLLVANLQMHTVQFECGFDELTTEQRIATSLRGPNIVLSLLAATVISNVALVFMFSTESVVLQIFQEKFLQRGIIPPITLVLFFWGAVILLTKAILINLEKHKPDNKLTLAYNEAYNEADNLSQSKSHFFECLWSHFESFYVIPRYINWAIPILGFIGTVLGISLATESLASLLDTTESDFSQLLSSALSPLGIAFDTTLIALSLSIALTLMQTLLYRWEEKFLIQFEQHQHQSIHPNQRHEAQPLDQQTEPPEFADTSKPLDTNQLAENEPATSLNSQAEKEVASPDSLPKSTSQI